MNCQRCNCTNYDRDLKGTVTDTDGKVIKCSICSQPPRQLGEYVLDGINETHNLVRDFVNNPRAQTQRQVTEITEAMHRAQAWMRILGCVYEVDTETPE